MTTLIRLQLFPGLTLPPSGNDQKASVTQFIGPVKVTINYSSPAVHGPAGPGSTQIVDRRGKIWGGLVLYGMTNPGFGPGKEGPWRAGANENTALSVSHPVLVEGKPLAAGKYGPHFIVERDEWTLILSKDSTSWESFSYGPEHVRDLAVGVGGDDLDGGQFHCCPRLERAERKSAPGEDCCS